MSELENQKAVSEAAAPIEEAAPTPEIDEVGLNPEEAAPVIEEEAILIIEETPDLVIEEEAVLIIEEEAVLIIE
ncbi:MAG: hypothetical protein WCP58_09520, partial [bacterium]